MLNSRSRVFETNSSSSHSFGKDSKLLFTVSCDDLKIEEDGYVHSSFGSFNNSRVISTEKDKLSYILTLSFLSAPWTIRDCDYDEVEWSSVINRFRTTNDFHLINQAIIEHFEERKLVCNGLWIDRSAGHIDEGDTITNYDSIESFLDFYGVPNASVKSYLFKNIIVVMEYEG